MRAARDTSISKAVTALTISVLLSSSGCWESGTASSDDGATAPSAGSAGDATSGAGGAGIAGSETGGAGLETAGSGGASTAGGSGSAGDAPLGGAAGVTGGATGSSATGGTAGTSAAVGPDCTPTGSVSYTLVTNDEPINAERAAYALITAAMDLAVGYYNCYTDLSLVLEVHFDATFAIVETQGTTIRFGAMDAMNPVTAMHEIAGIAGIGSPEFAALVEDGVFTGEHATAELRAITGDGTATLFADAEHFWPYGLNYPNEVKALSDLENHCRLVVAIRKDLGF
jgi:hypothetical protein